MKISRPTNIYQTKCEKCGGLIGFQTDSYRKETDAKGVVRYWHLPDCKSVKYITIGEPYETPPRNS